MTTQSLTLLANDYVELAFDPACGGALVSLADRASGYQFIRDAAAPKTLFRLALRQADRSVAWLDAREAEVTCALRRADSGNTLTLTAAFPGGAPVVTVEVSLADDSPLSAWRMRVSGVPADVAVDALLCPVLSGVMQVGGGVPGEAVATPVQSEGFLFTDPFPVVDHLPLRAGNPECPHVGMGEVHAAYPGALSMQLMLYYNRHAGLYLACHDADMHVKGFHLGALADWGQFPVQWIDHHPSEVMGGDAVFDYDTAVGVFHGDWYDGADLYKAWARRQWWCEQSLAERDIAPWVREGFGVWQMSNFHIPEIKLNHSVDQIADEVNALAREIGAPLAACIFNFERGGAWTGPVGLPPKEGEEAFAAAMAKLRAAGNHGFVYIPGGNWYVAIDSYDPPFDSWAEYNERGTPITIMNEKGELPVYDWYQGWHSTRLCPATAGNLEVLSDELLGCMRWGLDWVQIDNFPCAGPEACYAPEHGHPIGHGPWYTQAWRDTLAEVRRRIKAVNPDAVLSVEGMSEVYIPYLDLYDQRAGNMEYFGHWAQTHPHGGRTIPLFEYVYGGYVGAYVAAYPECNRPEVLYWTRCLGKALAQGIVPNAGRYWPTPAASNPVTLDFYKKVVRAAVDCWKYIMFGEMLRPPAIDVPEIRASYLQFTGECLDHLLEKNRHEVTDRAVQHGAFRAADGSVAYLFANVSQQAVAFSVTLDPPGLAAGRIQAYVDGERAVLSEHEPLPCEMEISIDPLSVTVIEVVPG